METRSQLTPPRYFTPLRPLINEQRLNPTSRQVYYYTEMMIARLYQEQIRQECWTTVQTYRSYSIPVGWCRQSSNQSCIILYNYIHIAEVQMGHSFSCIECCTALIMHVFATSSYWNAFVWSSTLLSNLLLTIICITLLLFYPLASMMSLSLLVPACVFHNYEHQYDNHYYQQYDTSSNTNSNPCMKNLYHHTMQTITTPLRAKPQ